MSECLACAHDSGVHAGGPSGPCCMPDCSCSGLVLDNSEWGREVRAIRRRNLWGDRAMVVWFVCAVLFFTTVEIVAEAVWSWSLVRMVESWGKP